VVHLAEALHYKMGGHSFDSRSCLGIFHSGNPSGRPVALRSTQPLTEMRFSGRERRPYHLHVPTGYLAALTSWNPQGLSRLC
jgi:hypothetical protein